MGIFLDLLVPCIVKTVSNPLVKTKKVFAGKLLNGGFDLLQRAHEFNLTEQLSLPSSKRDRPCLPRQPRYHGVSRLMKKLVERLVDDVLDFGVLQEQARGEVGLGIGGGAGDVEGDGAGSVLLLDERGGGFLR